MVEAQVASQTTESIITESAASPNSTTVFKDLLKNTEWPFPTAHLYRIAWQFFKDNESKAFHPSYDQRNNLIAYSLQEKHGKFNPEKAIPLGALDFVGHDRRNAWISLNDLSQNEAQQKFIDLLDTLCPLFRPYVIAVKCDQDEKERKKKEEEEMKIRKQKELEELERMKAEEEERKAEEEKRKKYDEQKRIIQEILNRQTIHQFGSYAKQQYPDNSELQEQLIAQLQEQHFQQYMQQMMEHSNELPDINDINLGADSLMSENKEQINDPDSAELTFNSSSDNINRPNSESNIQTCEESEDDSEDEEVDEITKKIDNASMWTRKDITTFKESIQAEGSDGILKVGHGEIATIRVPTHDNGSCIFWEFATDSYDIGFGLLFEWTSSPDNQVSIHISESEDEDEEEEAELEASANDVEKGTIAAIDPNKTHSNGDMHSPISVIIPIYRRDSHQEVFAGSHLYPGKGVYLLKFDNSYSLWRSKTLYYRVYYTKEP